MVKTRIDVTAEVDPRGLDSLRFCPADTNLSILKGMEQAGFPLAEAEVERNPPLPRAVLQ